MAARQTCEPRRLSIIDSGMQNLAQQDKGQPALREEFKTLLEGCGIHRPERGFIALAGEDRARWLNGMITNNIRDLAPGNGVYAFLLNPQGKIQGDLYAFNRGEDMIVETDRAQVEKMLEIFDRYIIMDDVQPGDLTGSLTAISITGPKSPELLTHLGFPPDMAPLLLAKGNWNGAELSVVRGDNPWVANYEIWTTPENAGEIFKALLEVGAKPISTETLEIFRIACGIPKFGRDIRERDLPQETAQDRALNFNKGCYVGQEIVERIRSRGAVHRTLAAFDVESMISPGARVQSDGKDVGEITSVAQLRVDSQDRVLALGYLRKEFTTGGQQLLVGEVAAKVVKLPFSVIARC
jgi:folate-binding protein YgfZ